LLTQIDLLGLNLLRSHGRLRGTLYRARDTFIRKIDGSIGFPFSSHAIGMGTRAIHRIIAGAIEASH